MRARTLVRSTSLMCGLLLTATLSGQTADFAQLPSRNFPVAGGNLFNQRYSTLTQVNKSTIATLGAAWMGRDAHTGTQFASLGGPGEPPKLPEGAETQPDLFTAIQQQLGLKLESTKTQVNVLVIDRIEKPSAN
jgi:hypothetical protein